MRVRLSRGQRVLPAEVLSAAVDRVRAELVRWSRARLRVDRKPTSTARAMSWQMPSPMRPWADIPSCLT